MPNASSLNSAKDDLLDRLTDQRITGFNAQMRVREEAAEEIKRLSGELQQWEERWKMLKWCRSCDPMPSGPDGGPTIGGGGGILG